MPGENLGANFEIDITNLKTGLAQANRLIRESNSEFKAAAAGMDDWNKSEEGLTAKLKNLNDVQSLQQKKVNALQAEYDRLVSEGLDPASDSAVKMRTEINNEKAALAKTESEIKKQSKALSDLEEASKDAAEGLEDVGYAAQESEEDIKDVGKSSKDASKDLEDMGDKAEDSGGKLDGLKSVAGGVVKGIAAVGAACVSAVGSFLGLAESTRESRTAMAKLETGFTTAGHSAEAATETYKTLYGVLGDGDKATEASAHLAQLVDNEKDLQTWTDICTGVYATFGDSLPIEGLTEAANETAKTGKLTGVLADALNWAGVSEDDFQASLDSCTTEQERQALITSTLNGLYDEAANKYREVNKDVIAAQEAQANLTEATNTLGAVAEPIMTTLKTLAADLLTQITPFVELIGQGLNNALTGTAGATDLLSQGLSGVLETVVQLATDIIPVLLSTIVGVLPSILAAITDSLPVIVSAIVDIIPQLTAALLGALPDILSCLIQIAASLIKSLGEIIPEIVTQIIAIVPLLIDSLLQEIPTLIQAAITFLLAIVAAIPTICQQLIKEIPAIINTIIQALVKAVPQLVQAAIILLMAICDAIPAIIDALTVALPDIIDSIITALLDALPQLLQAAITLFMAIIEAIPTLISKLYERLPAIIVTIVSSLVKSIPKILSTARQLFDQIISAIGELIKKLPSKMGEIISGMVSGLKKGLSKIKDVGKDLIKGLWEGISDMVDWIGKKIQGFGESVLGGLKSFFGIKSPSRVMADVIGKNLALGIGKGFEDNISGVNEEIQNSMSFTAPSVNVNGTGGASSAGGGVVVYQTNNYSQAHSRYELYKSKQQTAAAVRLAMGAVT